MLLLGIELGTSSVQVSVADIDGAGLLASAQTQVDEMAELPQNYQKEASPNEWWLLTLKAITLCHEKGKYSPRDINIIGIDCQTHGMVLVDKDQNVLYSCLGMDGNQAEDTGHHAFEDTGRGGCLPRVMELPGSFTTAKLAWLKQNEPEIYSRMDKVVMPGEYIAMRLSGLINTRGADMPMGFSKNVVIISMPVVTFSR